MTEFYTMSCATCGKKFRSGVHQYDGKHIARYQLDVCTSCYDGNWDGWNPRFEAGLLNHLAEKGMPIPAHNEKGLLPRD
jgi:hypothetical protein